MVWSCCNKQVDYTIIIVDYMTVLLNLYLLIHDNRYNIKEHGSDWLQLHSARCGDNSIILTHAGENGVCHG